MTETDLNLLLVLDALLSEGAVTGAARRLGLSDSAMSRALGRLRTATGDPLLVRAGRGLVPTPHALEIRDRVKAVAREAQALLRPAEAKLDLAALDRTFVIRANQGFVEALGPRLIALVSAAAPGARLRFAPKPDKDVAPLRDGRIDVEIGVVGDTGPEVRVRALFRDRFIGVARTGHPLLADGMVTPEGFAAARHVATSRRSGSVGGPVDDALTALGLERAILAYVPSFPAAMAIARASDLIALVPASFHEYTKEYRTGLERFELPVTTPEITISLIWHPRLDADAAHRWLRDRVIEAVATAEIDRAPRPVAKTVP